MKRTILATICASLCCVGCSLPASNADEEIIVFTATLRYLHARQSIDGRTPCFEQRMMRPDASRSPLIKLDQVYAFIGSNYSKIMLRCAEERKSDEDKEIRYQFYQPSISQGVATINVDSHCGSLCGRGLTFELKRKEGRPDWYVTSVGERWIS